MTLLSSLCAALFAAAKPLSVRRLAEACEVTPEEIEVQLPVLKEALLPLGLQLLKHANEIELVTHPETTEIVRRMVKDELRGELSRPALEALSILAYRGPLTRPELEQIRGVQSALILRNLLLRGLIEMREDTRLGQSTYAVTADFLKFLGLDSVETLPDYEALRADSAVETVLQELEKPEE